MRAFFRGHQIGDVIQGPPGIGVVADALQSKSTGLGTRAVLKTTGSSGKYTINVIAEFFRRELTYREFGLRKLDIVEQLLQINTWDTTSYSRSGNLIIIFNEEEELTTCSGTTVGEETTTEVAEDVGFQIGEYAYIVNGDNYELVKITDKASLTLTFENVTQVFAASSSIYRVWWVAPNCFLQKSPVIPAKGFSSNSASTDLEYIFETVDDFLRLPNA